MNRLIAYSVIAALAATGCGLEPLPEDTDVADTESYFLARLPGFVALGASITYGVGASTPESSSTSMFAAYLEDVHFESPIDVLNLAVIGATSQQILDDQTRDGIVFNIKHLFRKKVIWLASGGNDLLALVGTPGALAPCGQPPEVPALGVSFACYDVFRAVSTEYADNLRETLRRMRFLARQHNAVLMVRTELNGLDEDNCLADGGIDQQGNVWLQPAQIVGLRPLADLAMEGNVPAIPELGFAGFKGLNVIMRELAVEYDAVVVDTFATFKGAALTGGDLVTRDCVHPNDDGHAAIYRLAVEAFEAAVD